MGQWFVIKVVGGAILYGVHELVVGQYFTKNCRLFEWL